MVDSVLVDEDMRVDEFLGLGLSRGEILAGYSYEEYLMEWHCLFGDVEDGSVVYENERGDLRRLPVYWLNEGQFCWMCDVVANDSDPNRVFLAELSLLM